MNASILRKCIEELAKAAPDLSYVRGMLETLAELQDPRVSGSFGYLEEALPKPSHTALDWPMPEPRIVGANTPEGRAVEEALASLQGPRPSSTLSIEKNVILN